MSAATSGVCCDCGATFRRDVEWKKRCTACWVRLKRAAEDPLHDEIAANLPVLIQLCHPDRHNGSAASTRATQWLLDLRRRLPQLERAA